MPVILRQADPIYLKPTYEIAGGNAYLIEENVDLSNNIKMKVAKSARLLPLSQQMSMNTSIMFLGLRRKISMRISDQECSFSLVGKPLNSLYSTSMLVRGAPTNDLTKATFSLSAVVDESEYASIEAGVLKRVQEWIQRIENLNDKLQQFKKEYE